MRQEKDMTYEDEIKEIIQRAMRDGIAFTDKDMTRIRQEAIDEMSAETAQQIFGNR